MVLNFVYVVLNIYTKNFNSLAITELATIISHFRKMKMRKLSKVSVPLLIKKNRDGFVRDSCY